MVEINCLYRNANGEYKAEKAIIEDVNGVKNVYIGYFCYPLGLGTETEIKGWGVLDGAAQDFRVNNAVFLIPWYELSKIF